MATISRELADSLIAGNGKTKEGSAGYVLVRYQNRSKYDIPGIDLYDPDAKLNVFDYAIFRSKKAYETFMESESIGGVDVLWASDKFKRDELKREQAEIESEFESFVPVLHDLQFTKPGRRER